MALHPTKAQPLRRPCHSKVNSASHSVFHERVKTIRLQQSFIFPAKHEAGYPRPNII
jgi:hypothetical protein